MSFVYHKCSKFIVKEVNSGTLGGVLLEIGEIRTSRVPI
jgi:hypothetical protein